MYPKELPVAVYEPNRRFAEFSIEMDLKPKTLDDVVDVFDAYNINLVTGLTMGNLREDRRILEAFVDYTGAAVSLKEVSSILSKIPGVFNVEFKEGLRDDLAVCELHYPLRALGERAVVFRYSVLKSWFNRLWEIYGSGAGKIFYDAGVEAGKNAAKMFKEKFKLEVGDEITSRSMAAIGSALGWGRFTLEEFDKEKRRVKVRVEDSFECEIAGKLGETRGYFIRGYILGVATRIFKTENLTIEETRCIAKGDPYCEFQVSPR